MLTSSRPSILIIDDDISILRVFSVIFQRSGYLVTVAQQGREAIEKLRLNHYDVALIDFCLPDMEGTELFPVIEEASPCTLKVMLTGKALSGIVGADALVGKPIRPDKLLSIIDSELKNRNIETH